MNPNVPSKFQDHIQIGNETLILPDNMKGHRYNQEYHNSTRRSTNNFRGSLQILDSDHELENVVEIIEEGDEDITDLRRHATTPSSHPSQKEPCSRQRTEPGHCYRPVFFLPGVAKSPLGPPPP